MFWQLFSFKNCQDSRKAERFFKERQVTTQVVDLAIRNLSKGELQKIVQAVGLENIVDYDGKEYNRLNLKYMVHNIEDLLLTNSRLLKTPIIRNGKNISIGYCPELWQKWLEQQSNKE